MVAAAQFGGSVPDADVPGQGVPVSYQPYTGPMRYASLYQWLRILALITGGAAQALQAVGPSCLLIL